MEKSMKRHIIRRNVIYWGKNAQILLGMLLGFSFAYGFLFNIGGDMSECWNTTHMYLVLIGTMFGFICPVSFATAYIPFVISMGARRCESFWGTQFMYLAYIIEYMAVVIICNAFMYGVGNISAKEILFCVGYVALAIGLGQIVAGCKLKYNVKGLVLSITIIVVLIVSAGVITIFYFPGILGDAWQGLSTAVLGIIGAAIAIIYVASIVWMYAVMKNYEVRR